MQKSYVPSFFSDLREKMSWSFSHFSNITMVICYISMEREFYSP